MRVTTLKICTTLHDRPAVETYEFAFAPFSPLRTTDVANLLAIVVPFCGRAVTNLRRHQLFLILPAQRTPVQPVEARFRRDVARTHRISRLPNQSSLPVPNQKFLTAAARHSTRVPLQ